MAYVTLSGKRERFIEEQGPSFSWGSYGQEGRIEEIAVTFMAGETAGGKSRYLRAVFPPNEAVSLACYIAARFTRELSEETPGIYKRRTDAEALRALADMLEGKNPRSVGPSREELTKPRPAPWAGR